MEKQDLDNLQRLLDFHLERDGPAEHSRTQEIIASDEQIKQQLARLERMLKPLAAWEDETPPAGLTKRTLRYIEQHKQRPVLVGETPSAYRRRGARETAAPSRSRWILYNLRDLVAAAACIILVFVLMNPSLKHARQIAQQQACAANLQRVGLGLEQYAGDQNGLIPYVQRKPGAKWLFAGRQDDENVSNTRNLYLLVKQGYLPIQTFICPGRDDHRMRVRIKIDPQLLKTMQDFASRDDINYSFRLILNKQLLNNKNTLSAPLVSDQNPIFADFDTEQQEELDLSAQTELLQANSPNHAGRGQNVLFPDGRVTFSPDRQFGPTADDIFTVQSTTRYRGNEQPASEADNFIAP